MFGDVKFVCMGGSSTRMKNFAHALIKELNFELPAGVGLVNIIENCDRYVMYKTGPVLFVNHGMGIPSMLILLHEVIKLMHHAGCTDVHFFRVGTSGGVGHEPGSVVITNRSLNPNFEEKFVSVLNGKEIERPSTIDKELVEELLNVTKQQNFYFPIVTGATICFNDFYEEQFRLDGAFCEINEQRKMDFLKRAHENGIANIEMESACFTTVCHHAGIKAGIIAVILVNRLKGDQCLFSKEECHKWENRIIQILAAFIKTKVDVETTFKNSSGLRKIETDKKI